MFARISKYLFDVPEKIGLENYLVLVLTFNGAVIGFLGTIINIFLHFPYYKMLLTLLPSIVLGLLYLYSRIKRRYILSKYGLIFLSIIIINSQWSLNFGTYGPILYLFVVLQSFIIILFKIKERIVFSILIFLNISILFYIEFYFPDIFGLYKHNNDRLIDLYSGTLIYLALYILLISIALNFYIKQRNKAQSADKMKTSFLANMSHEIRTPMNSIIGFCDLLSGTSLDEKQQKYLNIISTNSQHLLKLIDDIIDISKIESDQLKISVEEFKVNDLFSELEQMIFQLLKKLEKKDIQLICNKPENILLIRSDYTRIKQVLTNLLSNACKFTYQGSIEFGCKTANQEISFFVKDTGIGIKQESLDEVFQRFKKLDNLINERIYRGTGLGLSISKQIVDLLGGSMWVESEPGVGSNFQFSIPTEIIEINDKMIEEERKITDFRFMGELIIIADDEDDNYKLIAELLNSCNLRTIRAKNGIEAVELCKVQKDIRLVLMDIKMPYMDGLQATDLIKAISPDIPVIAQTAYAMESDKHNFLTEGFDDYISKPISPDILFETVYKHLYKK